jgi:hypothetical protein
MRACPHIPSANPRLPCAHPGCGRYDGWHLILPEEIVPDDWHAALLNAFEIKTTLYERACFVFDGVRHWRWRQAGMTA